MTIPSSRLRPRTAIFGKRVRDYLDTGVTVLPADATIGQVVETLTEGRASSVVIADTSGMPAGIVTEQDITRRGVLQARPDQTADGFMTTPVRTIDQNEFLFHAIARLQSLDLRHLPAVDSSGKVTGMLHLTDALAAAAERTLVHIHRLTGGERIEDMRSVKDAQVELARELMAEDLPVPEIQALLTHVNNDLYQRVTRLALKQMREEGQGDPPVAFALIVMGSGGRGENFLTPDQDNGLILEDYPDEDHDRIDGWFIRLADIITTSMDAVGLEYCPGYVMASNPMWRKTLSQWKHQTRLWTARANPQSLQLADIFFDFDTIWGELSLGRALRAHLTELAASNRSMLRAMQHEHRDKGVGLGWFGRFITVRDKPEHRGKLNLKHTGTLPLIGALRILALREGIEETATLDRIGHLHDKGVLDNNEQDYLRGAYTLLGTLILRQQIRDYELGHTSGYYLHPADLSRREKDMLKNSLRAIRRLHERVRTELTGVVF